MFGKQKRLSLQITSTGFRMVQLQALQRGHTLVNAFDVKQAVSIESEEGQIASTNELRELLHSNGIKAGDVRVIFDTHPVSVTTLSVPGSVFDESSESMRWYAEQHSPISCEGAVINYRVCDGGDKDSTSVVLVSTDKSKVKNVLAVLNAAKIRIKKMDIVPFALERLFHSQGNRVNENAVAIIGLGETSVSVLVEYDGQMNFVRYFRILPDTSLEVLLDRLRNTLQSYSDWHPLSIIEKIYFFRMAERFPGLVRELQKNMGIDVEALDPMENITFEKGNALSKLDGSSLDSLAPLIGAAL